MPGQLALGPADLALRPLFSRWVLWTTKRILYVLWAGFGQQPVETMMILSLQDAFGERLRNDRRIRSVYGTPNHRALISSRESTVECGTVARAVVADS